MLLSARVQSCVRVRVIIRVIRVVVCPSLSLSLVLLSLLSVLLSLLLSVCCCHCRVVVTVALSCCCCCCVVVELLLSVCLQILGAHEATPRKILSGARGLPVHHPRLLCFAVRAVVRITLCCRQKRKGKSAVSDGPKPMLPSRYDV